MRSVKSSVKGWKAAAACLAVVIVIVVQALGLGAVWPQELAEPRLDEEIAKQEKIFQRRGADVPCPCGKPELGHFFRWATPISL